MNHSFCESLCCTCFANSEVSVVLSFEMMHLVMVIGPRLTVSHIPKTTSSCLWNACQAQTLLNGRYHFHSHLIVLKVDFLFVP